MKIRCLFPVSTLLALLLAFTACTTGVSAPSSTSLAGIESTLEQIYSQVNPSVVNINIVISDLTGQANLLASGFVWDKQGNIVTNNHVVKGATRLTVTFYDGTTVPAKVVGTDPDSDLAVVKVDVPASQLKPVQMADSTKLKVGQLAVAIGNPFGLQGTLTVGFVSGLGRVQPANDIALGPSFDIPDIIQTDASINPGNSGGVLLDGSGKVIGVTWSIALDSGASSGVGFAIPAAIVQRVVPALIKTGGYAHPYLGVTIISLDPDIAGAMGLPTNQRGALVEGVTKGGPSEKAGLRVSAKPVTINGLELNIGGDVVVAFDGQTVKSSDDLITLLARAAVGKTVNLTVLRDGRQVQVPVTLGSRPVSP